MGVNSPGNIVWTAENIHPRELHCYLMKKLNKSESESIHIDVDVLNVFHRSNASSYVGGLTYVANVMVLLASYGFIVTGIIDGEVRPECKRASWIRQRDRELSFINGNYCRQTALALASLKGSCNNKSVQDEIKKLNGQSRVFSKDYHLEVLSTFKEDCESYIAEQSMRSQGNAEYKGGSVSLELIRAKNQADSMIAYRCIHGFSHCVFTNDTDFGHLVGPDIYMVRSIDNKSRKKGISGTIIGVAGYTHASRDALKSHITRKIVEWTDLKNEVFSSTDQILRSYIAITIGCDVWLPGIPNVGPANVEKELKLLERQKLSKEEMRQAFLGWMLDRSKNNPKFNKEVILTLSQAILCESVVSISDDDDEPLPDPKFMYDKPIQLPSYLSTFGEGTTCTIIDGPPIATCPGINGRADPHMFLEAEGSHSCSVCNTTFCRTCGYLPNMNYRSHLKKAFYKSRDKKLCLGCYKEQHVTKLESEASESSNLTVSKMKQKLLDQDVVIPHDTKPHEVLGLFSFYHNKKPLYEIAAEKVPFPLHTSSSFKKKVENNFLFEGSFDTFSLFDEENITDELVPQVFSLFASILQYNDNIDRSLPQYNGMPSIVIDFAHQYRSTNVIPHKLIRSCLRHANDPRARSILHEDITVFEHDGEVGMFLQNVMPPSMDTNNEYFTRLAFSSTKIYCAECECDCSGKGTEDDRNICVHSLPLIYQLSRAFHEGIGVHFLIALAARWNDNIEKGIKQSGKYEEFRNMLLLMIIATIPPDSTMDKVVGPTSIKEILENYKASTEKEKIEVYAPVTTYELDAFRNMSTDSLHTVHKKRCSSSDSSPDTSKKKKLFNIVTPSPIKYPSNKTADDIQISTTMPPMKLNLNIDNTVSNCAYYDRKQVINEAYIVMPEDRVLLDRYYNGNSNDAVIKTSNLHEIPTRHIRNFKYAPEKSAQQMYLSGEAIHCLLDMYVRNQEHRTQRKDFVFHPYFFHYLYFRHGVYSYGEVQGKFNKSFVDADDIVEKTSKIIIPIHINSNHWTKIVVFMEKKRIVWYDPYHTNGDIYMEIIFRYLNTVLEERGQEKLNMLEWSFENNRCPR